MAIKPLMLDAYQYHTGKSKSEAIKDIESLMETEEGKSKVALMIQGFIDNAKKSFMED